jgi:hypothetical protein
MTCRVAHATANSTANGSLVTCSTRRAHESSDWFLVNQATGIRTELGGRYDGIEIRHGSFLGR